MDAQKALGEFQGKTALEKCLLTCATAVIYYALVTMGLALAIEPSIASPFWPAAGFALAAALLWGPSVTIGVFFAAWLINASELFGELNTASALTMSGLLGAGSALQALLGAALLRRFGKPQELLSGVGTAATQRVLYESSQLLHLMIESVQDYAIFRLDMRGRVASWSSGAQLIYGYHAQEITGRSYAVFLPPDADNGPQKHLADVARDGRTKIESWCVRKDSSRFWADIVLTSLRDKTGAPLGYVCIVRDATRRRAAERLVEEQSAALTRSNIELTQFAYVASHDLHEPLHKVKAFADRLKDKLADKLDDEGSDYLRRMLRSVDGMQNLIDDLLQLARVTTRGGVPEVVDLAALAKDVVESLELSIASSRARIEVGNLPQIHADPQQMRQLLQNLISNSLKFHKPDEKPRVRVRGRVTGDGHCEIVVSDDGIGFDMKYAERIFQPFQRLHGRYEYEGTGMGLAICQRIAARHGGTISATSRLGHGTEFKVLLPISQEGRMECLPLEKAFS